MMAAPRDFDDDDAESETRWRAAERARRVPMTYRILREQDYLRAELAHRETVEEMGEFLRAVVRNCARCPSVLIRVRESKPIFHFERNGLLDFLLQIARLPQHRIALVTDSPDLHASHEYLELIARQRGVRIRSFRSEVEALLWFRDRRVALERRQGGDRRARARALPAVEQRSGMERRRGERRARRAA